MKYFLVAAAAAIAAGGVFALRPPGTVVRERRVEIPVREEVCVEVPVPIERVAVESATAEPTPKLSEKRTAGISAPSLGPQEKMLFLFEREIVLSADQRRHFVRVLEDRALEIEEVNQGIAAAKFFSRRGYSVKVREIRARSYDRMAEVLDGRQYGRFRELVREGRLGDAVAITIQPDWTVID